MSRKKNPHKIKFNELQEQWIKTHDPAVMGEIYFLLIEFYKNYITSYAKNNGIFFYPQELEERATDCAGFTVAHYLRRPTFKIKSLTSYTWFDMQHELLKTKDEEMHTCSYEQLIEENDCEEKFINSILSKEIEIKEKEKDGII